jgi:hypothetical protein
VLGGNVERVGGRGRMFRDHDQPGDVYVSPVVIVTAGGTPLKLGIHGELEYAGKGVSYCAVCDGAFFRNQHIVVVGGGDAACEEADFLTRFASKVTLVHRRDEFRASIVIQQRVFENPKIEVVWNTVAEEVLGSPATGMTGLRVRNRLTGETGVIEASVVHSWVPAQHQGDRWLCARQACVSPTSPCPARFGLFRGRRHALSAHPPGATAQGDATWRASRRPVHQGGPHQPARSGARRAGDIGVPRPAPEGADNKAAPRPMAPHVGKRVRLRLARTPAPATACLI